jgi:hypothetical protein
MPERKRRNPLGTCTALDWPGPVLLSRPCNSKIHRPQCVLVIGCIASHLELPHQLRSRARNTGADGAKHADRIRVQHLHKLRSATWVTCSCRRLRTIKHIAAGCLLGGDYIVTWSRNLHPTVPGRLAQIMPVTPAWSCIDPSMVVDAIARDRACYCRR